MQYSISERLATILNVKQGDTITYTDSNEKTRKKASLKHRIIELVILLVIMIAVSAAGAIYDRYQNENKVMPDGQMTVHFIDVGND